MESKKIFIGGINEITTEKKLNNYFLKFGEILDLKIITEKGVSRRFGYITFRNESSIINILNNKNHLIDNHILDIKMAKFYKEKNKVPNYGNLNKKLFIGGLPLNAKENDIEDYFKQYGSISKILITKDSYNNSKGFGFITFKTKESAKKAMSEFSIHQIFSKWVEIKPFETKKNKKFKKSNLVNFNKKSKSFNKKYIYNNLNSFIKDLKFTKSLDLNIKFKSDKKFNNLYKDAYDNSYKIKKFYFEIYKKKLIN